MKWSVVRIALAVVVWLLSDCSGAPNNGNNDYYSHYRLHSQPKSSGNTSICLASEAPLERTTKQTSRDCEIDEDAFLFTNEKEDSSLFYKVTASLRGGSEEEQDYFVSSVVDDNKTFVNASETNNDTEKKDTIHEEQDSNDTTIQQPQQQNDE